jgi:hypothetical protein
VGDDEGVLRDLVSDVAPPYQRVHEAGDAPELTGVELGEGALARQRERR